MTSCLDACGERYATHLERGLEAAAGVVAAAGLVSLTTGAHGIFLGPWVVPVREVWRPFTIAAVLVAARGALSAWLGRAADAPASRRSWIDTAVAVGFACGITSAVLVWTHLHVRACGGIDSYGYVSAASAIASGDLVHDEPMTEWLPFLRPIDAATPLGWVAAPSGRAIVPGYPLGFPMVMAAAIRLGGLRAAFYVPLLAGLVILWLTHRLGRSLASPLAAAAAVLAVAWNPVLVNMAVQPMSDAPAACWYLLALTLLLAPQSWPAAAGFAFAMAVWTRPLVLALLPALLLVMPRRRDAVVRFLAGTVPVWVAMAGLQWLLYGGPLRTGYGGTAGLFTMRNVGRHLSAFARWTLAVHSPLFVLAFGAGLWRGPRRLALAALIGLTVGVVPYLFNLQYFDDWDLVRYILPGLIPCVIVSALGVAAIVEGAMPRPAAAVLVLALCAAVAAGSYRFISGESTWQLKAQEARYAALGDYVKDHTPPGALLFADLHSGSLRLYAGRPTLRWVRMPPGSLAPTLAAARQRGISCFAALDGEAEARSFDQQLESERGSVVAEPIARIRTVTVVRLSLAGGEG